MDYVLAYQSRQYGSVSPVKPCDMTYVYIHACAYRLIPGKFLIVEQWLTYVPVGIYMYVFVCIYMYIYMYVYSTCVHVY